MMKDPRDASFNDFLPSAGSDLLPTPPRVDDSLPAPADSARMPFSPEVLHLRRLQIRAVVVGVCAGLAWLFGLSFRFMWLAYVGAGVALLAWLAIPILGARAAAKTRRQTKWEPR
jgi:phage shock protein PspC (stress-responsive transcriptional regulator)